MVIVSLPGLPGSAGTDRVGAAGRANRSSAEEVRRHASVGGATTAQAQAGTQAGGKGMRVGVCCGTDTAQHGAHAAGLRVSVHTCRLLEWVVKRLNSCLGTPVGVQARQNMAAARAGRVCWTAGVCVRLYQGACTQHEAAEHAGDSMKMVPCSLGRTVHPSVQTKC